MKEAKKQRGVITQKMTSFRVDNENEKWLELESNRTGQKKGRLINNIIKEASHRSEIDNSQRLEAEEEAAETSRAKALILKRLSETSRTLMTEIRLLLQLNKIDYTDMDEDINDQIEDMEVYMH